MAQIAHYPGPDEPLYVPAEGEQIWLTDLDGHVDIYDNDSIKINYASGFDKNQITKVEVYRNGTKMRFLPEKLDVLTNQQMKTFDGNPLEQTPKSEHTDHAIFGYEYEFRFWRQQQVLPQGLVASVRSPIRLEAPFGVNVGIAYDALEQLSDLQILDQLATLKSYGFRWVHFGTFYYADSTYANSVHPIYEWGTPATASWSRTMRPEEVRRLLRLARQAGLNAELRLELWLDVRYKAAHSDAGWDREGLKPADIGQWFANYTQVWRELAAIAQEEGAKRICLGVELSSLEKYSDYWERLASDLRSVFSGEITFCEATCHLLGLEHAGESPFGVRGFEQMAGKFWDSMDLIEVDSWPLPDSWWTYETQKDQRLHTVLESFVRFWRPAIEYYRGSFPGKPIQFGEFGVYNYDGVLSHFVDTPWEQPGLSMDNQEVSDMWASMLIAMSALGADGGTVWSLVFDPSGVNYAGSFDLNLWPAVRTIRSFLAPEGLPQGVRDLPRVETVAWPEVPCVNPGAVNGFYCDGDTNLSHAKFWGEPGRDVRSVIVALSDDALAVRADLSSGDQLGYYRYIFCLNLSAGGRFCVFLDAAGSVVSVAYDSGSQWQWIYSSMRGQALGSSSTSVYALLPLEPLLKIVPRSSLERGTVDVSIDHTEGGRREIFFFPKRFAPTVMTGSILSP
jgi:hypothetical protein